MMSYYCYYHIILSLSLILLSFDATTFAKHWIYQRHVHTHPEHAEARIVLSALPPRKPFTTLYGLLFALLHHVIIIVIIILAYHCHHYYIISSLSSSLLFYSQSNVCWISIVVIIFILYHCYQCCCHYLNVAWYNMYERWRYNLCKTLIVPKAHPHEYNHQRHVHTSTGVPRP